MAERAVKFRARPLAPLVKTRGLRDDAVEVEQDCFRTLNRIKRILQASALKLVHARRSQKSTDGLPLCTLRPRC
jgi:hypothetical protein